MERDDYMQEKKRRLARALDHWEAMQYKYGTEDEIENGEQIGYRRWVEEVTSGDGTFLFNSTEPPLPHYYLYKMHFIELITAYPTDTIIPSLESSFYGDGIDLDYIEGLIDYFIECGVLTEGGPIVADDVTGLLRFYGEDCSVQELIEGGHDKQQIINSDGSIDIANRFQVVKNWVARKRQSAGYVDVLNTEKADTCINAALLSGPFDSLLLNYTLPELTALLIGLGLLSATTERATPAASPGAWVGVIHALLDEKRPRLKGSKAKIQNAFRVTFQAVVGERSVQNGLGKRGSDAEQFKDRALALLNK